MTPRDKSDTDSIQRIREFHADELTLDIGDCARESVCHAIATKLRQK